jgi:glycosyltransferase involved in cell wall biosynthesis
MSAKRALVCAPRLPEFDRESGSRRIFHLIEYLQQADWTVSFVTQDATQSERYVRLLQQHGIETVVGLGPQTDRLIATRRFDIALLAFWHLAEKYIPKIRQLSADTRVLVDMIDLHFLRESRRIFHRRNADASINMLDSKYASDMIGELNVYAMADAVLAVSKKEADLVNDLIGDQRLAHVVPDHEDLPASTVPFNKRNGILFIGNFWHQPNVTAAEYLCRDILPRLDPALLTEHPVYIVGNALDETIHGYGRHLSNVRFVGWVPSIVPYVNKARVSVIPLLTGAGTKRKLIQALMVGTPTVSTSIGTEGLDLEGGKHLLVADDPEAFANSIAMLLKDAALWERLRDEGRKRIIDSHGQQSGRASLIHAIEEVLTRPSKSLSSSTADSQHDERTPRESYQEIVHRIREVVGAVLPDGATVIVVSNGDDDLLRLGDRRGWHFPQTKDGVYAGYHPASSSEAISHVEMLRKKGGGYLLFPSTSFWWLDYYGEFKQYLETHYKRIRHDDTCSIYELGESSYAAERNSGMDIQIPNGDATVISKEAIESLRPQIPERFRVKTNGHARRKKVLILGVYLAEKQNNVDDIVATILKTRTVKVTQRWIALGGEAKTRQVADVTVDTILRERPKFQIINDLLTKEKLNQYDYVILMDDDIVLPALFLDQFIALQERLDFVIAQPARTSNSYIDHPIVEQQRGVLARRTLFVEIGPVVSFHKSVFGIVFPFDLTSPMGWGYENVWAHRLEQARMKMGIIDVVPVDHSLRKPVAFYHWDEANRQRSLYLSKHEHTPIDQCFRVLDVISMKEAPKQHGNGIAAH